MYRTDGRRGAAGDACEEKASHYGWDDAGRGSSRQFFDDVGDGEWFRFDKDPQSGSP